MKNRHQPTIKSPTNVAASLHPSRPRCQHVSRNGRPCRYLGLSPENPFCKDHVPPPPPGSPESLAKALEEMGGKFETPEEVNRVLYVLFFALAKGTITERRAGILTYIAQTILHSHRAMQYRQQMEQKLSPSRPIILDIPSAVAERALERDRDRAVRRSTAEDDPRPPNSGHPGACVDTHPETPCPGGSGCDPVASAGSTASPQAASNPSSPASSPPPKPSALNHFYPRDPALPPGSQDPNHFSPPPPSPEELERRNARLDTAHGSRSSSVKRSYPQHQDDDWKIINGR